jgi:hypothetical protein
MFCPLTFAAGDCQLRIAMKVNDDFAFCIFTQSFSSEKPANIDFGRNMPLALILQSSSGADETYNQN